MLGDNFIPNIEKKTGIKTKEFVALAVKKGLGDPAIKPSIRMAWLKEEFGLGHGHAMAMAHAIKTVAASGTAVSNSAPCAAVSGNARGAPYRNFPFHGAHTESNSHHGKWISRY